MTDDAWFGVTPFPVAERIAQDLPSPAGAAVVVDLFAGAGGNTIAFALSGRWQRVIGIEIDADTLACAQTNAEIAGVPDGVITWIHGDCFRVLAELTGPAAGDDQHGQAGGDASRDGSKHGQAGVADLDADTPLVPALDPDHTVVFASPPWGGITYTAQPVFDLAAMQPYGLAALHSACAPLPHALYLPRTSDLQQLADVLPRRAHRPRLDVVQYCMHGFSKALVAYYPADTTAGPS